MKNPDHVVAVFPDHNSAEAAVKELVFGGVTASLLDRPWLPILMSR